MGQLFHSFTWKFGLHLLQQLRVFANDPEEPAGPSLPLLELREVQEAAWWMMAWAAVKAGCWDEPNGHGEEHLRGPLLTCLQAWVVMHPTSSFKIRSCEVRSFGVRNFEVRSFEVSKFRSSKFRSSKSRSSKFRSSKL
eukprot:s710_g20.t1